MAPKKVDTSSEGKRAIAANLTPSKKQRVEEDVSVKRLAQVEQAIDLVQDVTPSGRDLLRLIVQCSLNTPPEERHRYQNATAMMLQEAFQGIEDSLDVTLGSQRTEAETMTSGRDSQTKELEGAKEAYVARVAGIASAKAAWLEDNRFLQSTYKALESAREVTAEKKAILKQASGAREELQLAVETQMPAIIRGDSVCMEYVQPLSELLAQLPLEDSLRNAANASLRLQPEARGFFDKTVLAQLSDALSKLLEAAPLAAEETSAYDVALEAQREAEARHAEARERQRTSATALREAELDVREAEGAEGIASEALQRAQEAVRRTKVALKAAEEALDSFRNGPMLSLKELLGSPSVAEVPTPAKARDSA